MAGAITERWVQEIIAQCVGIMIYYHNSERSEASSRWMAAEARAVGGGIMEAGLSPDEMESLVLRPVSSELVARYGHELGPRLNAEFLTAVDGLMPSGANSKGAGDGRAR